MTGAATSASADSKSQAAAETVEMPSLGSTVASGTSQAAHATQTIAIQYELEAAQTEAVDQAKKAAAKAKQKAEAEAKKKAAAAAKAKAEAEREAEARAARSSERSTLSGGDSAKETPASAPSSSPATGSAAAVVQFAKSQVGKPYVMGATGPNAYDCSGFTTAAFKQVGVSLPRVSQDQSTAGTEVGLSNLKPGDILYWGGKGTATHVAIYIGDGQYVGAQNPNDGVAQHPLNWGGTPSGAVRVL